MGWFWKWIRNYVTRFKVLPNNLGGQSGWGKTWETFTQNRWYTCPEIGTGMTGTQKRKANYSILSLAPMSLFESKLMTKGLLNTVYCETILHRELVMVGCYVERMLSTLLRCGYNAKWTPDILLRQFDYMDYWDRLIATITYTKVLKCIWISITYNDP